MSSEGPLPIRWSRENWLFGVEYYLLNCLHHTDFLHCIVFAKTEAVLNHCRESEIASSCLRWLFPWIQIEQSSVLGVLAYYINHSTYRYITQKYLTHLQNVVILDNVSSTTFETLKKRLNAVVKLATTKI